MEPSEVMIFFVMAGERPSLRSRSSKSRTAGNVSFDKSVLPISGLIWFSRWFLRWFVVERSKPELSPDEIQSEPDFSTVTVSRSATCVPSRTSTEAVAANASACFLSLKVFWRRIPLAST
ncbi:hypothetical protein ASE60_21040 [Ensifer sp. Root278]|nr:hypothetical protein ASE60_21040 [Ensifer sp. Root278]